MYSRLIYDKLKRHTKGVISADSFAWAAHMTEVRRIAEKVMLDAVVYT